MDDIWGPTLLILVAVIAFTVLFFMFPAVMSIIIILGGGIAITLMIADSN